MLNMENSTNKIENKTIFNIVLIPPIANPASITTYRKITITNFILDKPIPYKPEQK